MDLHFIQYFPARKPVPRSKENVAVKLFVFFFSIFHISEYIPSVSRFHE